MMDKGEISTSPNVIVRFNPEEDLSCTPSSLSETSNENFLPSHINSNHESHGDSEAGNGCTPTLRPVTITPIRYSEIDKCVHYEGTIMQSVFKIFYSQLKSQNILHAYQQYSIIQFFSSTQ